MFLSPEVQEAADKAKDAADKLSDAADKAQQSADQLADASQHAASLADQLAAAAHASPVSEFVFLGAIFVLAIFVGYYVVWSVTPALHTPLMSVTNAISSVVIVGALIAVGANVVDAANGELSKGLGFLAVAFASVNIVGGFLVTQRMLAMYKKKER